jgi:hypothetical protein
MGDSPKKNGQDQPGMRRIQVADSVGVRDSLVITARRADDRTVVGQRTVDEEGRQSGVDFDDAGGARVIAVGRPRQGEKGGKAAVERLARHLAELGQLAQPWKVVAQEEDPASIRIDVDCEIRTVPTSGPHSVHLRAQVTRAAGDHALAHLGRSGKYVDTASLTELADFMRDAIADKVEHYGGQKNQKNIQGLVLVLDALDHHASVATPPVIQAFQKHHGAFARNCGFDAIWLVGPTQVFLLSG